MKFTYFLIKKLKVSKKLCKSNTDIATIYSSIAQTYEDLNDYENALKYFELEIITNVVNDESVRNNNFISYKIHYKL